MENEKFEIVGLAPNSNNKLPVESSNTEKKAETPGNKTPPKERKKKKKKDQKSFENVKITYGIVKDGESNFTEDNKEDDEILAGYETKDDEGKSNSEKLARCAKDNNRQGFNTVYNSCDNTKEGIRMLTGAIVICAENENIGPLQMVVKGCPKALIVPVLSNAIAICAKNNKNTNALRRIVENACPRKEKQKILSKAKEICRKDREDEAIQKINAHEPIDIDAAAKLVKSRTNWLIKFAEKKYNKGIKELLKNIKEKQLPIVEVFSNAIVTCAKKGDKKTLKRIIRACPKELKTEIVNNAIAICKKDTELLAIINIKKASTSWIKRLTNNIFRNYNKKNDNNEDSNSVTSTTSAAKNDTRNPEKANASNRIIDYFSNRKKSVAEITELSDKDKAKIDELAKEIVDSINNSDIESLNKTVFNCFEYLKEKVFAKVMDILKEKNIDTSSRSLGRFYAHNLVFSAVNNDKTAFDKIKHACPDKLQEFMFAEAMLIYEDTKLPEKAKNTSDFKKNMSVFEEDTSISKESLLVFKDDTSVFSNINTLSSPLVGIIYAHNLVFSAVNDDKIAFNKIKDACPDKLQEIMFTEAKAKSKGMKNEKKIIEKINGAYLEYHGEILTIKMNSQEQINNGNYSDDENSSSQETNRFEEDGIKELNELCVQIQKFSDTFNGEKMPPNYEQKPKVTAITPSSRSIPNETKWGKSVRKRRTSFPKRGSF